MNKTGFKTWLGSLIIFASMWVTLCVVLIPCFAMLIAAWRWSWFAADFISP